MVIPPCPRCGGQVLSSYGESSCFQCGWCEVIIPDNIDLETRSGPKLKDTVDYIPKRRRPTFAKMLLD